MHRVRRREVSRLWSPASLGSHEVSGRLMRRYKPNMFLIDFADEQQVFASASYLETWRLKYFVTNRRVIAQLLVMYNFFFLSLLSNFGLMEWNLMDKSPAVQFPISTSNWWWCQIFNSWTAKLLFNQNTLFHMAKPFSKILIKTHHIINWTASWVWKPDIVIVSVFKIRVLWTQEVADSFVTTHNAKCNKWKPCKDISAKGTIYQTPSAWKSWCGVHCASRCIKNIGIQVSSYLLFNINFFFAFYLYSTPDFVELHILAIIPKGVLCKYDLDNSEW